MIWAILLMCWDKPVHARKRPDFRFQIRLWFEWGYAALLGGWGLESSEVTGLRNDYGRLVFMIEVRACRSF